MTQKQTLHHTPPLRFPEFRGAWAVKPLAEVCSKIPQGGTPDTTKPDYWNGSINWLTPAEMGKTKDRFMHTTVRKITELGLKKCSSDLLPINSIIVSTRAPIGYLTINKTEMAFNQGCKGLIPKEETDYNFLYYCLLNSKYSLIDLGAGSTFKELTRNDLKKFKISFPSLTEQKKIAECLSSLDDVITVQGDRLDGLKDYKRGLMQQLFPADGQTTPALRFPKFQGKAPWEKKRLGEVCEITTGKSNAQDHKDDGIYPLFDRSAEIKKSDKFLFDTEAVIIPGEGMGFIPKYYKGKFDLHQRAYALKDFVCSGKFVYYQMDFLKQFLASKAVLSTILSLRLPIIKDFCIIVPKEPAEQQKIANCLSVMDDLITGQKQIIKDLKHHKNGLMQQLFPEL